jgi:sialate O-acetylesterase
MPVTQLKGFALAGANGCFKWAKAAIEGNKVMV